MDIRRLIINNGWGIIRVFKKILLNPPTSPKAFDLPTIPKAFKNTVLDLYSLESSSSIPKKLLGINARLGNSKKKKATQQILVRRLKSKTSI